MRLDFGQLRKEPAITDLDWLFTPIPKSEKRLSAELLQASTTCNSGFTLLRHSSIGFGSDSCDLWHVNTTPLITCGLFGFPLVPLLLNLATEINSPARYSKRTTQLLRAASLHNYKISDLLTLC